jgi:SAM-dependent methyltransferase
MKFKSTNQYLGDFSPFDGTVEFYGRIHSIIRGRNFIVADVGAGRGQWFTEDIVAYRRYLQYLKPIASRVIGLDIDTKVFDNLTTSENRLIFGGIFPLENESVDVVLADWVFEHIDNPSDFVNEINRILKPGGFLFARTPHKNNYFSLFARFFGNKLHVRVLKFVQPNRLNVDVFPTKYKMNEMKKIGELFSNYHNFSYIYTAEPAYFFGKQAIYTFFLKLHKYAPNFFCGCIYVFLQKNYD